MGEVGSNREEEGRGEEGEEGVSGDASSRHTDRRREVVTMAAGAEGRVE